MNTEYKYIRFEEITPDTKRKTKVFALMTTSNDYILGEVEWYPSWRQYCFFPTSTTVFSPGCLDDIAHFLKQLMDERKSNA